MATAYPSDSDPRSESDLEDTDGDHPLYLPPGAAKVGGSRSPDNTSYGESESEDEIPAKKPRLAKPGAQKPRKTMPKVT